MAVPDILIPPSLETSCNLTCLFLNNNGTELLSALTEKLRFKSTGSE